MDDAKSGSTATTYLGSRSFWGVCLGFGAYDAFWYGLMTWGALYLAAVHHLNIKDLGWSIFLIYAVGTVGQLLGGVVTDKIRQSAKDTNAVFRRLFPLLGVCIAVPMYLLSVATDIYFAIAMLSISMFFEKWCGTMYWSLPSIVADRQYSGTLSGIMNMFGNVGGAVVPIVVGLIVGATGSYYWALMLFIALALGTGLFPVLINFDKKIGME